MTGKLAGRGDLSRPIFESWAGVHQNVAAARIVGPEGIVGSVRRYSELPATGLGSSARTICRIL